MESFKISIDDNNVVYTQFNMFIVRTPFNPICFYLSPEYIIGFVQGKQAANAAHFPSCLLLADDIKEYQNMSNSLNACQKVISDAPMTEVQG